MKELAEGVRVRYEDLSSFTDDARSRMAIGFKVIDIYRDEPSGEVASPLAIIVEWERKK